MTRTELKDMGVVFKNAAISECGYYRYALWRIWDTGKSKIMFIGLNPSTADAYQDDPTLRRCIGFAKSWGYGRLVLGNLFALRATDPKRLAIYQPCPIGPRNNYWLRHLANSCTIVAAWGSNKFAEKRSVEVIKMFPNLMCLDTNKSGAPKHPLYAKADLILKPFPLYKEM